MKRRIIIEILLLLAALAVVTCVVRRRSAPPTTPAPPPLSEREAFFDKLATFTPGVTTRKEAQGVLGDPVSSIRSGKYLRVLEYEPEPGDHKGGRFKRLFFEKKTGHLLYNKPFPFSYADDRQLNGRDPILRWAEIQRRLPCLRLGMTRPEVEMWVGYRHGAEGSTWQFTDGPPARRRLEVSSDDDDKVVGIEPVRVAFWYTPFMASREKLAWWEYEPQQPPLTRAQLEELLAGLEPGASTRAVLETLGGLGDVYSGGTRMFAFLVYYPAGAERDPEQSLLVGIREGGLIDNRPTPDTIANWRRLRSRDPAVRWVELERRAARLAEGMTKAQVEHCLGLRRDKTPPDKLPPGPVRERWHYPDSWQLYRSKRPPPKHLVAVDFDQDERVLAWRLEAIAPPAED